MEKNKIDSSVLKTAMVGNSKLAKVLKHFSTRDRGRRLTSFTRLRNMMEKTGETFNRNEFKALMKPFLDAGAGHLIERNDEMYFQWEKDLNSVACGILGVPKPIRATRWSRAKEREMKAPKSVIQPITVANSPRIDSNTEVRVTLRYRGFEAELGLKDLNEETCGKIISVLTKVVK